MGTCLDWIRQHNEEIGLSLETEQMLFSMHLNCNDPIVAERVFEAIRRSGALLVTLLGPKEAAKAVVSWVFLATCQEEVVFLSRFIKSWHCNQHGLMRELLVLAATKNMLAPELLISAGLPLLTVRQARSCGRGAARWYLRLLDYEYSMYIQMQQRGLFSWLRRRKRFQDVYKTALGGSNSFCSIVDVMQHADGWFDEGVAWARLGAVTDWTCWYPFVIVGSAIRTLSGNEAVRVKVNSRGAYDHVISAFKGLPVCHAMRGSVVGPDEPDTDHIYRISGQSGHVHMVGECKPGSEVLFWVDPGDLGEMGDGEEWH